MSDPLSTERQLSHTPAPWKEHAPKIDGVVDHNYRQIKAGCGYFPEEDESESGFKLVGFIKPADTRLIVAAPDLLQALRELLPMVEEWHAEFPRDVGDKEAPAIAAARAAIAKAEGRRMPEDYPPSQAAVIYDNGDYPA
jgi:hypothetical protein